jgi:hypothetical protein
MAVERTDSVADRLDATDLRAIWLAGLLRPLVSTICLHCSA